MNVTGVLTYDDVTSVDSVGIINSRAGVNITGGKITLGDSGSTSDDRIVLGASSDLMIYHNGSDSVIRDEGTGNLNLQTLNSNVNVYVNTNELAASFITNGAVELYHDSSKKLETLSTGAKVTGVATVSNGSVERAATISTNHSITSNFNAMSAGPVTVSATITIPSGSVWTIV